MASGMELDDFVAETLEKILGGIREVQTRSGGGAVNAENEITAVIGSNLTSTAAGMFARIDFDIAITTDQKVGGGAGVKVFGLLDMKAEGGYSASHVSRISFAVPIRLPDGDRSEKLASLRHQEQEDIDRVEAEYQQALRTRNRTTGY